MATSKQTQAARSNVEKAQQSASRKKTIAHMPRATRTALGKQGAAVAQRKRTGGTAPKTRAELYEIAKRRDLPGRSKNGPRRTGQEAGREIAPLTGMAPGLSGTVPVAGSDRPTVVAVANRLPVQRGPSGWELSAGGLVTALRPVMTAHTGAWWAGTAERKGCLRRCPTATFASPPPARARVPARIPPGSGPVTATHPSF